MKLKRVILRSKNIQIFDYSNTTSLNMPPVVVQISQNFQMETTALLQVNNQIMSRGN